MKNEISSEQVKFYQDNGYVVIENFLEPTELEVWRDAVDEGVAVRGNSMSPGREGEQQREDGDDYFSNVFVLRYNLWMDNDKVRKLILDPRLGKMACDLTGEDGMRIWHDQALIKQPWGNPTGWHLDNPYWSYHNPNALTIWVALDDATIENGCMYFVPGAHKTAITDENSWEYLTQVQIDDNVGALFNVYPHWADKKSVAVSMKAGSCSFHSGIMPHGAGANMTPGSRRAMTCGYMPDGSTFNGLQNVLPDSYFKTLEVGDVLDNDDQNPLIYHASKPYVNG